MHFHTTTVTDLIFGAAGEKVKIGSSLKPNITKKKQLKKITFCAHSFKGHNHLHIVYDFVLQNFFF